MTLRYLATRLCYLLLASFFLYGCGSGGGDSAPAPAIGTVGCNASANTGTGGGSGGRGGGTFILSGTISPQAGATIDCDVNDVLGPTPGSNDALNSVQQISNPTTLGGYVNVAGSGPGGNSFSAGDSRDVFSSNLTANQRIILSAGDPSANLDLRLFDAGGNLVTSSAGTGVTETITVPTAGAYFIEVLATSGASTYILNVGTTALAAGAPRDSSADFVPGEVIVRFRDNLLPAGGVDAMSTRAQSVGMLAVSGGPGRDMLLSLGDDAQKAQAFQSLGIDTQSPQYTKMAGMDPAELRKHETLMAVQALRARPDVQYAEPNYIRQAFRTPNDEFFGLQWHYPLINLPQAWDITVGSPNVIVAVIDTGVLLNHPDLQGQLVPGFDFISSPLAANDGDGIDADPNDSGDLALPGGGSSFHGTHVSGTVAAASNNATGVAGVAWESRIMPLRVLGRGGGTDADIVQAIRYAAGLPTNAPAPPAQRADVINMSLGGPGASAAVQAAVTAARAEGVIVVAAAGNAGNSVPNFPASFDGVVSVSAVSINQSIAPYSSFGSTVDVAAPGGDLQQDLNGDGFADGVISTAGAGAAANPQLGYQAQNGTSMSSPHIAGVVALMKALNPALTPALFDTLLETGQLTTEQGDPGRDDMYGHGLIDAQKAVIAAGGDIGPILTSSPTILNLGSNLTSDTLTLSNVGNGTLTVATATSSEPWLTVSEVAGDGLGAYTVTVNRSGLPNGPYAGTITFDSDSNDVTVTVNMQVGAITATANMGFHFVLLVDENNQTVGQRNVAASNGVYNFVFTNVAPGNYRIIAGTDSDNDDVICDPGEACGIYLTIDQPLTLNVNDSLRNLNFTTGFGSGVSSQSVGNTPGLERRLLFPKSSTKQAVQ